MEDHESQEQRGTLSDLQGLVDLAEKVSANVQVIEEKMYMARLKLWASLVPLAALFYLGTPAILRVTKNVSDGESPDALSALWVAVVVVAFTLFLFFLYVGFRDRHRLSTELQAESRILRRLLAMIHPLKENISKRSSVGPVPEAILEMRLKRIQFSTHADLDESRAKIQDLAFSGQEAV